MQEEVKQLGTGEIFPIRCDLRVESEILEMFAQIKNQYGGVDVCVNNAGIATSASLLEGSTDDWRDMMNV